MALQIRRGPNAQRATTLLQTGEVAWTTDTKKLYVGDGVTTGGVNILANIAGTGFVWNPSTEQLDLAGSTITGINADNVSETNGIVPRLWYRPSLGKTHASEIFTTVAGAAHTGISFSWDDVNQKLTATVLTENAADAAAALFTSGTHTGISFTYGLTEDAANRIDATVSSEYIQDTINDLFTAGVHTGITFTYSDSLNALSAAVTFPGVGGNLVSNLALNGNNITGSGNINITGNITATGLGANLSLNSYTINGAGNINISGTITGTTSVTNGTITLSSNNIKSSLSTLAIGESSNNLNEIENYSRIFSLLSTTPNGAIANAGTYDNKTSRGSTSLPTACQAGDYIGGYGMSAHDGTDYQTISLVGSQLDVVTGTSLNPGKLWLATRGANTGPFVGASLDSRGVFESQSFRCTPFATAAARDIALPTGVVKAGMICFLTDVKKLQINTDGTTATWVDLH